MNIEQQLSNAVEAHKGGVEKNIINKERVDAYVNGTIDAPVARLRLDWSLSNELIADVGDVRKLMAMSADADLSDLLENGDVDSDDMLYKSLNGTKKRGKDFEEVEIIETVMYHERKDDCTEYTLYILLYTK